MLKSYLIGVVGVAGLMVLWAIVQQVWGRYFLPASPGADVLERRGGCRNCGCSTRCASSEAKSEMEGRLSASENDERE